MSPTASYRVVASKALQGRPVGRVPVLRHPVRRSQRCHPPRASSRAAGLRHLLRLAEPRRFEIHQHPRHRRRAGRAAGRPSSPPGFRLDDRERGRLSRASRTKAGEYLVEGKKTLAGMASFGLYVKNWRTIPLYRAHSVGAFPIDNTQWDPERWKPRYANSAFRSARLDDKFWAARRLQAFTDEMLNAAHRRRPVQRSAVRGDALEVPDRAPQRDSPPVSSGCEPGRRRAPVDVGYVDVPERRGGCRRGPHAAEYADYVVVWQRFDNATGTTTNLGETRASATSVNAPKDLPAATGTYIRVEIPPTAGRRAGRNPHTPTSGARGLAGRWSASSVCRAAIPREAKAPAAGLTEVMRRALRRRVGLGPTRTKGRQDAAKDSEIHGRAERIFELANVVPAAVQGVFLLSG